MSDKEMNEPPVLGAGEGHSPLPTTEEEWMAHYVLRMIERGVPAEEAWACCRASDHDYNSDPRDAADDEMYCWTAEGERG